MGPRLITEGGNLHPLAPPPPEDVQESAAMLPLNVLEQIADILKDEPFDIVLEFLDPTSSSSLLKLEGISK